MTYEEYKDCKEFQIRDSELHPNLYLVFSDDVTNPINGSIFTKDTNTLVCAPARILMDISEEEIDDDVVSVMEWCEDGTLVRLYYYNGEWLTATNKSIDSRFCFWNSTKSFNELFYELFSFESLDKLDKTYTYFFIVTHVENQIIIRHKESKLYYAYKIRDGEISFENDTMYNSLEPAMSLSENNTKRGVVIRTLDGKQYKYDFPFYVKLKEIRGNTETLRERYFQVFNDKDMKKKLNELYPEYSLMFKILDRDLEKLSNFLHQLYYKSHITHTITLRENPDIYSRDYYVLKTLKNMHYIHKTQKEIMTRSKVQDILTTLHPVTLVKLLNYKN